VAYTIKTDGTVSDVQVVKAEPPGPWESQALDRVQNLAFSGVIVPGYQEVVVTFFQD
jgi:outer membrane biosynthesis protein TonB